MKISYISPVLDSPSALPNVTELPQSIISQAIEQAIDHAIIKPFKGWVWRTSIKTLLVAEWGCIIGCAFGIIMVIMDLQSGSKVSKVCFLAHFGIQVAKVVLL